jgi:SAM-dependent methyltransferase
MAQSDRARWDARYAEPNESCFPKRPHRLLVRYAPSAVRALDLACGLGQDALWLAERGCRVDAIDISFVALRQARHEMRRRGLSGVTFIQADLDQFVLPRAAYDLVCVFRFLDRRLFPAIRNSVRPGGVIIYETLNTGHLERNPDAGPDRMLRRGELPGYFPGWQVIEATDDAHMSAFVGRKPD